MELECSLQCSQQLPTRPYPYSGQLHFTPSYPVTFNSSFINILLPSTQGSSKWNLSFRASVKILYACIVSHTRTTRPTCLIFLDLIIRILFGKKYKSWRSSMFHFLRPPISYSFLGPRISLSTLSSNTFSLYSSLNTKDQVSHPYKTP